MHSSALLSSKKENIYLDYKQQFEPDEPEPTSVPIVTGFGSQCYANDGNKWGIERSLDKDAATIFHSSAAKNGWAIYYFPPARVTQVRILNRADCCGRFHSDSVFRKKIFDLITPQGKQSKCFLNFLGERMTGESVWVCEGDDCKKCGDFQPVGNGQWGIMTCGDKKGIEGSSIKVVAPTSYLQISRAEVYGTSKCFTNSIGH